MQLEVRSAQIGRERERERDHRPRDGSVKRVSWCPHPVDETRGDFYILATWKIVKVTNDCFSFFFPPPALIVRERRPGNSRSARAPRRESNFPN